MLTRCQCREIWAPFLCTNFAPRPAPTLPADLRYAPHCGLGRGIGAPCPPRAETPSRRPNRAAAGRFVAFPPRVSPRPPTAPLSPALPRPASCFATLRSLQDVAPRGRARAGGHGSYHPGPRARPFAPRPAPCPRADLRSAPHCALGRGIGAPCPPSAETAQPAPYSCARWAVRRFPALGVAPPAYCAAQPRTATPPIALRCVTRSLRRRGTGQGARRRARLLPSGPACWFHACPLSHPPSDTTDGRAPANGYPLRSPPLAGARPSSVSLSPSTKKLRGRGFFRADE